MQAGRPDSMQSHSLLLSPRTASVMDVKD